MSSSLALALVSPLPVALSDISISAWQTWNRCRRPQWGGKVLSPKETSLHATFIQHRVTRDKVTFQSGRKTHFKAEIVHRIVWRQQCIIGSILSACHYVYLSYGRKGHRGLIDLFSMLSCENIAVDASNHKSTYYNWLFAYLYRYWSFLAWLQNLWSACQHPVKPKKSILVKWTEPNSNSGVVKFQIVFKMHTSS